MELPVKIERPKQVHGKTYKIRSNAGKLFLTINNVDGQPFEIFVKVGKAGDDVYGLCEAIGRLCSLSLRFNIPSVEIKKTLDGVGGDHEKYPSVSTAIARKL